MNSWEMERSLGGELDAICGGFSEAAGFSITSNAKPPAFVLGLSATKRPTKHIIFVLPTNDIHEEYQ